MIPVIILFNYSVNIKEKKIQTNNFNHSQKIIFNKILKNMHIIKIHKANQSCRKESRFVWKTFRSA